MDDNLFTITERRCKVCMSKLREQIDGMLMGDIEIEDRRYTYAEIIIFAQANGLELSAGGLTRHRTNHLMPSMRRMLETQRNMEAIEKATGKKLSLPRVFTGLVLSKILRVLEDFDEEQLEGIDPIKLLREGTRAAQAALQIEKAESLLSPKEMAEAVKPALEKKGISQETIELIEKEILGL
jgi:glutathione S-transferase